jgi:hypothetical protein
VLADVDADGDLDVAALSNGVGLGIKAVRLFSNDGLGGLAVTATLESIGSSPGGLVVADLDVDGDLDLVTANAQSDDLSLLPGIGAGSFVDFAESLPAPIGPADVVAGDFDLDGDIDLAAAVVSSDTRVLVFRNVTPLPAPSIASYGCGVNPPDSLVAAYGEPALGTQMVFEVDNPFGTQAFASLAYLVVSTSPDAAFPCGTPVPGWGMGGPGAVGEVLVGLHPGGAAPAVTFGGLWVAPGVPAVSLVPMPVATHLVGSSVFVQGVLVDPAPLASVPIGLTNALELTFGF